MGVIQDRAMARLADPLLLGALLEPRARFLVERTHELEYERIDSVAALRVRAVAAQWPLFPVDSRRGNWMQVLPGPTRTDFCWEGETTAEPVWVDVLAELEIDVVAETDPGGLDSLVVKAIDEYATLDEFRAQFRFLDLDAFMHSHGLATVEDLRESGEYLRTEVRLRPPPVFDPASPVNRRTVAVDAAVVVGALDDVAGAVRAARLVAAAARGRPPAPGPFGVRVAPYALVAAFTAPAPAPASAPAPSPVPAPAPVPQPQQPAEPGLTRAQIESLLEGAGIAAVFLT
ncbi:hypothetical protein [Streptomyces sp. NPDC059918]|uniref:hypothetical protein n=1 Tax=unclassified Streptomyces TaxID=2593676 RepID=UPI0036557D3E